MIIKNAKVFIDGQFRDTDVRYDSSGILEIGKDLAGDEVIDAKSNYLYAGMVDAHCHGGFKRAFNYHPGAQDRPRVVDIDADRGSLDGVIVGIGVGVSVIYSSVSPFPF